MRVYNLMPEHGSYREIEDRRRRRADGTFMGYDRGYSPVSHYGVDRKMRELEEREAYLDEREAMMDEMERSRGRVRRIGYESYPMDSEGFDMYPEMRRGGGRYY